MTKLNSCFATTVALAGSLAMAIASTAIAGPPQYDIFDLGLVDFGDFASQGFGVSPGGIAFGRSVGVSNQAFTWTLSGGLVGLPNDPSRAFSVANGANDSGFVVGNATTTLNGAGSLPIMWQNGTASIMPLVSGETVGRANGINSSNIAVGSNGGGSGEFAVIYDGNTATQITATTSTGSMMTTAFGINDAGLIAGIGTDPNNAARNVGMIYDSVNDTAFEVGALNNANGAIAFDVGNGGHVVGASMMNQGAGRPFIWDQTNGIQEIALPSGASSGSARGVNSNGWVVGNAGGQFAVPWFYDGNNTFRLQDLIGDNTGWDLSMNTSSSALGISDDGVIVGTGLFNGEIRGFAMTVVPAPGAFAVMAMSGLFGRSRRRGR